ncbi:MAG: ribosomal-processing cysteine protease Prp [Clostridia bacterium]|nr:ribosomal-processing cysteine protease Prp [Clostridia bacterium]
MIRIRVLRRADGLEVAAIGHAGTAPRGQDIVCAGVSALLYGFIAYLESLSPIATAGEGGEAPHLEHSEGEGRLRVITRGLGGADVLGWAVIEAGLRLIEAAYPAAVSLCPFSEPRTFQHQEVKGERYESK